MRRMRMMGCCLVAACALGALFASAAQAEGQPEFGRCVKLAKSTGGKYRNSNCTERSEKVKVKKGKEEVTLEEKGGYEWLGGTAVKCYNTKGKTGNYTEAECKTVAGKTKKGVFTPDHKGEYEKTIGGGKFEANGGKVVLEQTGYSCEVKEEASPGSLEELGVRSRVVQTPREDCMQRYTEVANYLTIDRGEYEKATDTEEYEEKMGGHGPWVKKEEVQKRDKEEYERLTAPEKEEYEEINENEYVTRHYKIVGYDRHIQGGYYNFGSGYRLMYDAPVECASEHVVGEAIGSDEVADISVRLTGCAYEDLPATSEAAEHSGEIQFNPLKGRLGYIEKATHEVGLLLEPVTPGGEFASFLVGGGAVAVHVGVGNATAGSFYEAAKSPGTPSGDDGVISPIVPVDQMTHTFTQKYSAAKTIVHCPENCVLGADSEPEERMLQVQNVPSKFEGGQLEALESFTEGTSEGALPTEWNSAAEEGETVNTMEGELEIKG